MSVKIYPPAFDGDKYSVYVCYGYRSYLYALCDTKSAAILKKAEAVSGF